MNHRPCALAAIPNHSPMIRLICFAYTVLFLAWHAVAQDVIYPSTGEPILCKIVSVEGNKIKYTIAKNPGPSYTVEGSGVSFIFNGNGNVLTFPLNNASEGAAFMNPPANKKRDILVTVKNSVIECEVVSVGKKDVKFKKSEGKKAREEKLSKKDIAVILYKDGKHEFGVSAAKAVIPVKMTRSQIDQLTGVSAPALTTRANSSEKDTPKNERMTDGTAAFPGGEEEFDRFRQKAVQKVDEFGRYIATIVNPKTPADKSNSTIELAFTLFVNEEVRVEVSNVNTGVKNKYKIKDYLRRLKLKGSDYQEVEVSYADIGYASDFVKGPDGNYYGVVSFVQTFKGFADGKMLYGDVTQRNITVILKLYEKAVEGEKKKMWDVFLADVGILETRKL